MASASLRYRARVRLRTARFWYARGDLDEAARDAGRPVELAGPSADVEPAFHANLATLLTPPPGPLRPLDTAEA